MPDLDLDTLDPDKIDASDPDSIKALREAYKRQKANADEARTQAATASKEAGDLKAAARKTSLEGLLEGLEAPKQLAELYPADGEVTAEALKTFLQEKVGIVPNDVNDTWSRYEATQTGKQTPPPPVDSEAEWIAKEVAATEEFYRRNNAPTDQEIADMNALKLRVQKKMGQWDDEIMSGKRDPIIAPGGFGGLTDPPSYAVRARHYMRSSG